MSIWYLADRLPPFRADPLVFGERDPSGPKAGPLGPLRQCAVHEVTWRSFDDTACWLCEAAS